MTNDNPRTNRKRGFLEKLLSSINFLVKEDVNTKDQRRDARIECRYEVSYVDEFGTSGTGTLIDISRKGLQMESPVKVRKGVTLAIKAPEDETLDRTAPFMAKVCWCRKGEEGYRVGLALPPGVEDDPHWLESLLHQLDYSVEEGQRREHIRAAGQIPGRITPLSPEEREPFEVEVRNLGMGGALLKSQQLLARDSQFELRVGPHADLPELALRGTILRVVEKSDHVLYPCRFRTSEEPEDDLLREYILKLSGRD